MPALRKLYAIVAVGLCLSGQTPVWAQSTVAFSGIQQDTSLEVITRKAVAQQAQQAMQGFAVQPDETLVAATAVEVLLSFIEANEQMGPERLAPIAALLNGYRALMQQAAAPEQKGSPEMTPEVEQQAAQQNPGVLTP